MLAAARPTDSASTTPSTQPASIRAYSACLPGADKLRASRAYSDSYSSCAGSSCRWGPTDLILAYSGPQSLHTAYSMGGGEKRSSYAKPRSFTAFSLATLLKTPLADFLRIAPFEEEVYHREWHVKEADIRAEEEAVLELIQEPGAILGIASECIPGGRVGQVTIQVGIPAEKLGYERPSPRSDHSGSVLPGCRWGRTRSSCRPGSPTGRSPPRTAGRVRA